MDAQTTDHRRQTTDDTEILVRQKIKSSCRYFEANVFFLSKYGGTQGSVPRSLSWWCQTTRQFLKDAGPLYFWAPVYSDTSKKTHKKTQNNPGFKPGSILSPNLNLKPSYISLHFLRTIIYPSLSKQPCYANACTHRRPYTQIQVRWCCTQHVTQAWPQEWRTKHTERLSFSRLFRLQPRDLWPSVHWERTRSTLICKSDSS